VFVSTAKNMPASILINGLGQAAATLRAQAKNQQLEDPHMAFLMLYKAGSAITTPVAPTLPGPIC
jgi:hypothetical protein